MKRVILAAALTAVWCVHADDALRRKYIGHGWDLLAVTPEEVLAHADEFDRTGLDGVAIMPRVTAPDGRVGPRLVPMDGKVRTRDELKGLIPVFREIVRHRGLRESFLFSMWAPSKRLAWTNDAAWASFAANMGTMAWLAKEGGMKGLMTAFNRIGTVYAGGSSALLTDLLRTEWGYLGWIVTDMAVPPEYMNCLP